MVFRSVVEGIVLGILTGSVYALMASGLTLIFGVMDIINVAHAMFVIVGAYLIISWERVSHLDPFLGLLVAMPLLFALGVGIYWFLLRRIRGMQNHTMLSILLLYAITLITEGVLNLVFTANFVQIQAPYVDASFPIFGFYLPYIYVLSFVLSIALLSMLYILVYRTKFGGSLRASIQNRTAAALIGIDVDQISAFTFGIGIALAAAGGLAFGATNAFNAASSFDLIARLAVIIVLGGMGSLRGALIASFAMLIISDVISIVGQPVWSSTIFFFLLVVLLVFRPQGLFGQAPGRKQ